MKSNIYQPAKQVPFLLRVIWFFLLGWELTGMWILIAWVLNVTIIGLPLGLWMLDRVPQVLTLKARPGGYMVSGDNGRAHYHAAPNPPFPVRALYFVLIGWWFSLLWAALGWLLCASIIGLPLGVLMLNKLPSVTTLHRS
ncbi:MAG: YccF domain-containing protein [Chloroflexi bacterium]|nr:YccF domain-containing protein [Chloroflexota bacterium]